MEHQEGQIHTVSSTIDTIKSKLIEMQEPLMQAGLYGLIGFLTGFFVKRYFQYVLISCIVVIAVYVVLDNFEAITVDWTKIQHMTGIDPDQSLSEVLASIISYLRVHWLTALLAVIGFAVGYSIG